MKKTSFIRSILVLVAVAMAMLTSCSKSVDFGKLIPNDALAVIDVNLLQVIEKGDLQNADKLSTVKLLRGELRDENRYAASIVDGILDDPMSAGIDVRNDMVCYVDNDLNIVVLAAINDGKKFETFLNQIAKAGEFDFDIDKTDGLQYATIDDEDIPMSVSWNSKYAIMVVSTQNNLYSKSDKIASRLNLAKSESMASSSQFRKYWSARGDVSAWCPMGNVISVIPGGKSALNEVYTSEDIDAFMNSSVAFALQFDNGAIRVKSATYGLESSKMMDMMKHSFNASLLKYLPEQTLAAATLSFNVKAMMDYLSNNAELKEALREELYKGVTIADLINCFDGSIAANLHGIIANSDGTPTMPLFAVIADVNDISTLKSLMSASGLEKNGSWYEDPSVPIYLAFKDKMAYITNDQKAIQKFVDGTTTNGIAKVADKAKKGNYVYIDMDVDNYPSSVTDLMPKESVKLLRQLFSSFEIVSDGNTGEVIVHLKDKKQNSLAALIHFVDDNLMTLADLEDAFDNSYDVATDTAYVSEDEYYAVEEEI